MTTDAEYALYESAKSKFSVLLSQFEEDDGLIDQSRTGVSPVKVNEVDVELTIPPTASDAIQNAVDHILTDPRISVPERQVKEGQDSARKSAERLQQFYATFWDNVFTYCGDPLGYGKTQLIKGKLVIKKTIDWDAIPELPESPSPAEKRKFRAAVERAGKSTFLWKVQLIPKETVFEIGEQHDPDVFEAYKITNREGLRRFGEVAGLSALDPLDTSDYVEYWERPRGSSKGKFIQWVNGERVHAGTNPYCWEHPLSTEENPRYDGYVPYVIGDPGWGDITDDAKPEDRYISIIRRARSVIRGEIEMMTSMREYLKYYVFKPLVTKNIPDDKDMYLLPGAVWNLQDGQEAQFVQPGEMPVGLLQGLSRINQYVDQTAKLGTLGGTPLRGVDTATEADQTIRNAAAKLSGPIRTLRRMIAQMNRQVGQDVELVLEAPVTLYGTSGGYAEVTVKPSDFNGFYLTHVELDTSDEAALNLNNARTWSDLAQRMPISFKTVMKMAGIMNGSKEMDERMLENLEQSAPAMQWLLQQMFPQAQAEATEQKQMPNAPTQDTIDQQARQSAQDQAPARAFR